MRLGDAVVRARFRSLHVGPLATFPQGPAAASDDVRATVLAAAESPLGGLLAVSLDPADALALLCRVGPAPVSAAAALERLAELGAVLLAEAAAAFGVPGALLPPTVDEQTLVGAVLAAHPPPDTRVLSIELVLEAEASSGPGVPCVLLWLAPEKLLPTSPAYQTGAAPADA